MPFQGISAQTKADWKLTFTPNFATGQVTVDLVLTPQGDLMLVTGIDRLIQMIVMWLLTPQGSLPWDPSYGNPYYQQLGRPASPTLHDDFLLMLTTCEDAFLAHQDQAYQAGQLTLDEMVDHFADEQVSLTEPGYVVVSFTVYAKSGVSTALTMPFASSLASGQAILG